MKTLFAHSGPKGFQTRNKPTAVEIWPTLRELCPQLPDVPERNLHGYIHKESIMILAGKPVERDPGDHFYVLERLGVRPKDPHRIFVYRVLAADVPKLNDTANGGNLWKNLGRPVAVLLTEEVLQKQASLRQLGPL